jgi:molybdate transport system substrate-binding protein
MARRLLILLALLLATTGTSMSADAQQLTVLAAASLKNALDEVAQHYPQRRILKIAVSYAGSSALARQIENGAPADIFISADRDWMDYVEKRGLIRIASRVNLLRNELVLIAPAASAVQVELVPGLALAPLLGKDRLAMADPDYIPAGKYGKAALETLGVWRSVAGKIARAENVRAALNFVSRGEAPLGIVYRTDAAADRKVRIVAVFPADTHPPVVYPAALLAAARDPSAALFFEFLQSAQAQVIFNKHGFVPY